MSFFKDLFKNPNGRLTYGTITPSNQQYMGGGAGDNVNIVDNNYRRDPMPPRDFRDPLTQPQGIQTLVNTYRPPTNLIQQSQQQQQRNMEVANTAQGLANQQANAFASLLGTGGGDTGGGGTGGGGTGGGGTTDEQDRQDIIDEIRRRREQDRLLPERPPYVPPMDTPFVPPMDTPFVPPFVPPMDTPRDTPFVPFNSLPIMPLISGLEDRDAMRNEMSIQRMGNNMFDPVRVGIGNLNPFNRRT